MFQPVHIQDRLLPAVGAGQEIPFDNFLDCNHLKPHKEMGIAHQTEDLLDGRFARPQISLDENLLRVHLQGKDLSQTDNKVQDQTQDYPWAG